MKFSVFSARRSSSLSWRAAIGVISLGLAVLAGSSQLFAQGNAGRILGGVTDQSGGAVVGATINIIDTQRNLTRTVTTDSAGEYNVPNLLPSTYTVRAAIQGFKTAERSGVMLEVNQDLRVDLTLQPGEQTEKVTVDRTLVEKFLGPNRYEPERNFSITYSGIPSAISAQVDELTRGRFFVEWAADTEAGTWSMEREAVAMLMVGRLQF